MGSERCPFCGQEIDSEARKCFFCGSVLDKDSIDKQLEKLDRQDIHKYVHTKRSLITKFLFVVVIVVLAIIIFYPKGTLKAQITYTGSQYIISNNNSFAWTDIELDFVSGIEGRLFALKLDKISSGQTITIKAAQFTNSNGDYFDPTQIQPQQLKISCDTPYGRKSLSQDD